MSTHRYFDAICVVVLALTLLITVLFMNGEAYGIQVIVDEDAEAYGHAVPSRKTIRTEPGIPHVQRRSR